MNSEAACQTPLRSLSMHRLERLVRRAPAAFAAALLALLVQLSPLFVLGRPLGVSEILRSYPPWATRAAPPPGNPLLDDAATGMHPWLAAFRRDGLWVATPNMACGAVGPLAGLFGILSPSVLLPFLLPRALAFSAMAAFDLLFAFFAFYVWRRRRGDGDLAAAVGAAVWAWSPARVVYRTWPFCGLTALFPLLLLAVDFRKDRRPSDARQTALIGAALSFALVLGGHPSFALLGIYLALAFGAARLAGTPAARWPRARSAAGLVGIALAITALSPMIALGHSFLESGEWRQLRAGIGAAPPVPWRILFLLFDPSFYGDPVLGNWRGLGWAGPDNLVELQLYMGLLTLLLAPLAFGSRRRREALFFAAVAVVSLFAMLGLGPFATLFRMLPGIGIIYLSRLRLLALFGAAVLASLGMEVLLWRPPVRWKRLGPALLLFLTLDLSLADLRFDPFPREPDAAPPRTPAITRLMQLAPGNGRRFLGFGTALVPNLAFEFGLEDVRAHLLFSAGYRRLLTRLDPQVFGRRGTFLTFEPATFRAEPGLLDLLGVSALIAPPGSAPPGGDFVLDLAGPDADVYLRPWHSPAQLVVRGDAIGAQTGRVVTFEANRMNWRIRTAAPGATTLLLGRSRLPLVDRVRVDGLEQEGREDSRAEGLLAIDLTPGNHDVAVSSGFPKALLVTSFIGFAGLVLLLGLALRSGRLSPARLPLS